jgi:hypothetical protein
MGREKRNALWIAVDAKNVSSSVLNRHLPESEGWGEGMRWIFTPILFGSVAAKIGSELELSPGGMKRSYRLKAISIVFWRLRAA